MTVEFARTQIMQRPWGVTGPVPWMKAGDHGGPVGEIWFERPGETASEPALLLKLLFASQPLSIQVHPDDAYAQSKGLANGKTEAWYVMQAAPGAAVALGLKQQLTPAQLRQAVHDGSIAELVAWHAVSAGDAVFVPAGTIHAIGAGLVIAEIQQRSDATYRLFDHGRQRELHVEDAIAVASTAPAELSMPPTRLTEQRTMLVRSPYFVFERMELGPDTLWRLDAEPETWLLVLSGGGIAGSFELAKGDAIFLQSDRVDIRVGMQGMVALAAYTGDRPLPNLLQRSRRAKPARRTGPAQLPVPTTTPQIKPASADRHSGLSR